MDNSAHNPRVILRDAASGEWLHFERPQRVLSTARADQVVPLLKQVQALVDANGWHAAGFVSYEAAPGFDNALATHPSGDEAFPLLWFGLYPAPRHSVELPPGEGTYRLGAWVPSLSEAAYDAAVARIRRHIAAGETYQVNFTFRLQSEFTGDPWPLFVDMLDAQPVGYPAFIDTGRQAICCSSPELFFQLDGRQVTCRPMKGTAGRGRTAAEDEAQARWLRDSEKNRAENVMIVDMLRNDLGRVAVTGSVRVPQLFSVERYRTLWQMTSTVSAESDAPFSEIFAALFPSASITGAPKVRTMGIIAALEGGPRRAYTGAIGYLAPGRQAQFNVAIRSVIVDRQDGRAEYGLGGGIVWDSTAQDEYAEALLKARILAGPQPAFSLLETLRWAPGERYFLLAGHLARLRVSAAYFGFPFDEQRVEAALAAAEQGFDGPQRVRLLLGPDGIPACQATPLPEPARDAPLRVGLAGAPVRSDDVFLFHKTTRREVYERACSSQPECDDVLLYNERGELTEASIANLVFELDGQLFTPPVTCGLLAGTFRGMLLEQGTVRERVLQREELERCTKLFLVNSVRGWQAAELC